MSGFYEYFSKTLKFPFLRTGSTLLSLIKGIALVLDNMLPTMSWLRDQFIVSSCEKDYLRRFAASRAIKRYSFESDDQYRDRIFAAFVFFAQAGKESGIKQIFALYGLDVSVRNMRDTDMERWAEFELIFSGVSGDVMSGASEYIEIINDIKAARSKLAGVVYELDTVSAEVYAAAYLQTNSVYIVQP